MAEAAAERDLVEQWMRHLVKPEIENHVRAKQENLRQEQIQLLLEASQLRLGGAAAEAEVSTRKRQLNVWLSVTESYLLVLHCCLQKIDYFRMMLEPSAVDSEVQDRLAYQVLLERVIQVEFEHVQRLFQRYPDVSQTLVDFRRDELPFKLLVVPVLQQGPPSTATLASESHS